MNKKVLNTPFSWTEGRVLLEISFNNDKTPIEVANNLDLDKSYTSRILNRFEKKVSSANHLQPPIPVQSN